MRIQTLAPALLALIATTAFAAAPAKLRAPDWPREKIKLICKTGPEKRAPGQPLRLFFQYNLPYQYEPEDPTVPFGRQVFVLAGRPVVQLYFEKATAPAGERGEFLEPMQCGFAKRAPTKSEPSQVQILMPKGETVWLSQTIGQKPGYGPERTLLSPGSDWSFAYQYDKVFTIELDDGKDFVTAQKPKPL